MSTDALDRLSAETVAETCRHFGLSEEAKKLPHQNQNPGQFLGLLIEKRLYADAIRFMAYTLSKRQAVWWACLCVWDVLRPDVADEKVDAALRSAVQWVLKPEETTRRQAQTAAKEAKLRTPAGGIAMAAFWSEGSMSRPGLPEVPPDPRLTAKIIAGAVTAASKQNGKAKKDEFSRRFLALGLDVAAGRNRWS